MPQRDDRFRGQYRRRDDRDAGACTTGTLRSIEWDEVELELPLIWLGSHETRTVRLKRPRWRERLTFLSGESYQRWEQALSGDDAGARRALTALLELAGPYEHVFTVEGQRDEELLTADAAA